MSHRFRFQEADEGFRQRLETYKQKLSVNVCQIGSALKHRVTLSASPVVELAELVLVLDIFKSPEAQPPIAEAPSANPVFSRSSDVKSRTVAMILSTSTRLALGAEK